MIHLTKIIFIGSLLFFNVMINSVIGARILGIFPMPARSHRNLYHPLMMELAQRGHDITVITPFEEENFTNIFLNGFQEILPELVQKFHSSHLFSNNPLIQSKNAAEIMTEITEMTLANENVQKLINSNEKFDLVIITSLMNRAHMALATHFEAPLVIFSTVGANSWVNLIVDNPAPPSYVPDLFLGTCGKLTFYERFINSLALFFNQVYFSLYVNPSHNKLIKKYIPKGPEIEDVVYNVSLVLLNSHPSINQAVPFVPNMVEIGGFHIKPPKKLPNDLQEFLDSAQDGVIYFSMGSNLKSSEFPLEKRKIFLDVFAKLKLKVLWKFETDLPGQPPNVKIAKWLPQQDILAHPNIKLFITHGGLLSITETVYHGIPVLAIPVYGDQALNARIAVENGFGLTVSLDEISEEILIRNIEEILHNSDYRNSAQKRSKLFHDRLVNPMETAMYWLEYVIRYKGAPHLKVGGLKLEWYKYYLIDVIGFIIITTLISLTMLYRIIKTVCRYLCCHQTKLKRN